MTRKEKEMTISQFKDENGGTHQCQVIKKSVKGLKRDRQCRSRKTKEHILWGSHLYKHAEIKVWLCDECAKYYGIT